MREPSLKGKQATFFIVSKISETEQATPPCSRFAAATPKEEENFISAFCPNR